MSAPTAKSTVKLRAPQPGDMGWVVMSQARLYAQEYGWNAEYEALAMKILADFALAEHPGRENAWIAEVEGRPAGAVFLMHRSETEGQLRLLHVESFARGLGVGGALVDQCILYARQADYERLLLWTNDVLTAAVGLYRSRGFALIEEAPHHSFGHDLHGQIWALDL